MSFTSNYTSAFTDTGLAGTACWYTRNFNLTGCTVYLVSSSNLMCPHQQIWQTAKGRKIGKLFVLDRTCVMFIKVLWRTRLSDVSFSNTDLYIPTQWPQIISLNHTSALMHGNVEKTIPSLLKPFFCVTVFEATEMPWAALFIKYCLPPPDRKSVV